MVNIFKAKRENPTLLPKAYTYIGVSKLSCHGCDSLKAFNYIHKTDFMTKGSHGKSYYPWQFPPQSFADKDDVLEATYSVIADLWVKTYNGYRPKFVPLRANSSTTQSGREIINSLGGPQESYYAEAKATIEAFRKRMDWNRFLFFLFLFFTQR